jgi:glycosyltransferase involved in cell wall biosynthesis
MIVVLVYSFRGGGTEKFVSGWLDDLTEPCTVITILNNNDDVHFVRQRVIALTELSRISIFNVPYILFKLVKTLHQVNPALLVTFLPLPNLLGLASKYLLFFMPFGLVLNERSNLLNSGFLRRQLYKFYPLADAVIVNSLGLKEAFIRIFKFSPRKVFTIYNALDLGHEQVLRKPKLGKTKFVFVGRLHQVKNIFWLIDRFQSTVLKEECLYILGDGPLKESIQRYLYRKNINNVFLMGFYKVDYSDFDIFVMASLHEGFPNVLIEAANLGLSVVVSDFNFGPRELVEINPDFSDNYWDQNEEIKCFENVIITRYNDCKAFEKALVIAKDSLSQNERGLKESLFSRFEKSGVYREYTNQVLGFVASRSEKKI